LTETAVNKQQVVNLLWPQLVQPFIFEWVILKKAIHKNDMLHK